MTAREKYLGALADLTAFLNDNAAVELPTHFNPEANTVDWLIFGDLDADQRTRAAAIVSTIGGHWDKRVTAELFRYTTRYRSLRLQVVVDQEKVCRRVVTGTREVTTTVPDPTVEVPLVEVTETVEDVEWVCGPLLAEGMDR